MKLFFSLRKCLVSIFALFIAACGGGGNAIPPNQNTVNLAINDLTSIALVDLTGLGDILAQSADCQAFEDLFDLGQDFTTECALMGNFVVRVDEVNCSEGPPRTATDSGTQTFNNCQDNDSTPATVSGTLDFSEEFTSNTGSADLTSSNYVSEGISFVFDITVILQADGSGLCSGSVTADGFDCDISADCTTCTL